MKTVKVLVGTIVAGSSGQVNDDQRAVEFEGEFLASHIQYGMGRHGGITDSRGVTETLYRTEAGQLVVLVRDWSHWQGEPDCAELREIAEADLAPNGEFERLGREAGMSRPLTLAEALS